MAAAQQHEENPSDIPALIAEDDHQRGEGEEITESPFAPTGYPDGDATGGHVDEGDTTGALVVGAVGEDDDLGDLDGDGNESDEEDLGEQDEEENMVTVRSADDNYVKGIEHIRRHQYAAALQYFSRAIFLAPGEPLPYVARAEAYTHLCDLRSAIANYRKALTLMRDPIAAEDLKARLAQVLDTYGITFFKNGAHSSALRFFEESLQEKPLHPTVLLHQCLCWVALGLEEKAVPVLRGLVKDPSIEADASVVLIQLLIKDNDFATAKKLLEEMLYKYQEHARVLDMERMFDQIFYAYKVKAQRELDIDALTQCIAAFGEDADLFRMRAIAYANHKSYTLAVQDLFSCINKSGGSNPVAAELMSSILCTIADELVEVNDFVSAANYYGEAIKWSDDLLDAYIARGDCLQRLGKHENALTDYKHVAEIDPQHTIAKERLGQLHDTWGSILYNQGSWKMAEAEFTRAIQYHDQLPAFHYHRALARIMMQEQTLAVRDLISCRDLGATDTDILRLVNQFCQGGEIVAKPTDEGAPASSVGASTGERRSATGTSMSSGAATGTSGGSGGSKRKSSSVGPLPPVLPVGADLHLTNKGRAQLKRDGDSGVEVWRARFDKGESVYHGKYNPTAIRDHVRATRIAQDTCVLVENPPTAKREKKIVEMEDREKVRVVPMYVGGPRWRGTQVKIPSRLDLVSVSEASPVPIQFMDQQRKRVEEQAESQRKEEQRRNAILNAHAGGTTVGGGSSGGVFAGGPNPTTHKGKKKGPRLAGFSSPATTTSKGTPTATFSVLPVGLRNRTVEGQKGRSATMQSRRSPPRGVTVAGVPSPPQHPRNPRSAEAAAAKVS